MVWAKEQSDDDLLQRVVAGDEAAFVLIYRRWQGRVYRFALHMSGSPSLAEDVTQEVLGSTGVGGGFQPLARRLNMTAKIFHQNAGGAQIAHHPFGVANASQAAPNQQPVKTGQNSLQVIGEFRDK